MTRLRLEGFAGPGTEFIIFPMVARPSFGDPAWREQFERECKAKVATWDAPPPRTRPLLVVDNEFTATLDRVACAMREG